MKPPPEGGGQAGGFKGKQSTGTLYIDQSAPSSTLPLGDLRQGSRPRKHKPLPPECPADFDPAIFPILARHWYGDGRAAVCVEARAQPV